MLTICRQLSKQTDARKFTFLHPTSLVVSIDCGEPRGVGQTIDDLSPCVVALQLNISLTKNSKNFGPEAKKEASESALEV
jgi:hypothetical protein